MPIDLTTRLLALDADGRLIYPTVSEVLHLDADEPDPEPPPPAGDGRLYVWVGGWQAQCLVNDVDTGGISASTLWARGIDGVFISGQGQWWDPVYATTIALLRDQFEHVGVGMYFAQSPIPSSAANVDQALGNYHALLTAARNAGANVCGGDCEPYGQDGGAWWEYPAGEISRLGDGIGEIAVNLGYDEMMLYTSSGASFRGSYQELVAAQAGWPPDIYDGNRFPMFVDGLRTTTPDGYITITDAVFHHGPQLAGETWASGAQRSADLIAARWADVNGSIMYWPDITEGNFAPPDDGYPPGTTGEATSAALAGGTGPAVIYQHHLTDNTRADRWLDWLDEILAAHP